MLFCHVSLPCQCYVEAVALGVTAPLAAQLLIIRLFWRPFFLSADPLDLACAAPGQPVRLDNRGALACFAAGFAPHPAQ